MIDTLIHLTELRKKLILFFVFFILLLSTLLYFSNFLFAYFTLPLLQALPLGSQLIATKVASPLIVPVKVAFYASIFMAMPVLFYQLWTFVAPALYRPEKYFFATLFIISCTLFYLGLLFAYVVVCPIVFKFFISALPPKVSMMTDINDYLTFLMQIMTAFGFCFEVPVIIFLLFYLGILNDENVKKIRPFVIVFAFILGMLLTPPDVISQIMLAIPLWLFFELGILVARLLSRSGLHLKNRSL